MDEDRVNAFYKDAKIFITGATGFVGMAVVEKLLRSFSDIQKLCVLINSTTDLNAESRLEELKNNRIFNRIREEGLENRLDKLQLVTGDVSREDMGLSTERMLRLAKDINVVFHCASSIDFENDFHNATNINLLGTRRVIEFCKRCKDLKGFVYVSSAYANSNIKDEEIAEELYEPPGDPNKITDMLNEIYFRDFDEKVKIILNDHINIYTLTKSLAEHEVNKTKHLFPTAIVRPSIVLGSWREPKLGWTISKTGPQGFIMGAARGLIRRVPLDEYLVYDYIPVDVVVNYIIASAWFAATKNDKPDELCIFHCTTSTSNPFRWVMIRRKINSWLREFPLIKATWYPCIKFMSSMTLYRCSSFIYHTLPAIFFDSILKISGRRPLLVIVHRNIDRSYECLEPFIFNEWFFNNKNTRKLTSALTLEEQQILYLDTENIKWTEYFANLVRGIRLYMNMESDATLPSARRRNLVFFWGNFILQILMVGVLWSAGVYFSNNNVEFSFFWALLIVTVFCHLL